MGHASNSHETEQLNGQCLCGAVTVTARMSKPMLRACHCDMCRRHTSSMFMSLGLDPETIVIDGPVKTFRSSDWAQRGFCEVCGSTIFYGTIEDGARHLSAGLFDNAGGADMKIEFFADAAPKGYALAGDHKKLTTQQTLAMFEPQDDDNA